MIRFKKTGRIMIIRCMERFFFLLEMMIAGEDDDSY